MSFGINAIGQEPSTGGADKIKKLKQFYGMMKANPQVAFNVFNNFIQGDTKDLPGLLNGSSAAANLQILLKSFFELE